jgi:hypothetical protein
VFYLEDSKNVVNVPHKNKIFKGGEQITKKQEMGEKTL